MKTKTMTISLIIITCVCIFFASTMVYLKTSDGKDSPCLFGLKWEMTPEQIRDAGVNIVESGTPIIQKNEGDMNIGGIYSNNVMFMFTQEIVPTEKTEPIKFTYKLYSITFKLSGKNDFDILEIALEEKYGNNDRIKKTVYKNGVEYRVNDVVIKLTQDIAISPFNEYYLWYSYDIEHKEDPKKNIDLNNLKKEL